MLIQITEYRLCHSLQKYELEGIFPCTIIALIKRALCGFASPSKNENIKPRAVSVASRNKQPPKGRGGTSENQNCKHAYIRLVAETLLRRKGPRGERSRWRAQQVVTDANQHQEAKMQASGVIMFYLRLWDSEMRVPKHRVCQGAAFVEAPLVEGVKGGPFERNVFSLRTIPIPP